MPVTVTNPALLRWVDEIKQLTNPKDVVFCDGSQEEADQLFQLMIKSGQCIKLVNRPNSYFFRSNPLDVARVESKTYICSKNKDDAGPLNIWRDPSEMNQVVKKTFTNAFQNRTMYVCVFSMGPVGGDISQIGVQITDSPYAVVNTRILSRMGQRVVDILNNNPEKFWFKLLHATTNDQEIAKSTWPCQPNDFFCAHFVDDVDLGSVINADRKNVFHVASFGSGYGGNSLLLKKCLAIRLASVFGKHNGSLAEHMLIMGVKDNKTNETTYLSCAMPSACGKTNLALAQSVLPSHSIVTLGDDIAWIKPNPDGRLYAINPENGFFGVAPGTNRVTNPTAMDIIAKDTIFTNVAIYPDHSDVWFEGLDETPPAKLIDWQGQEWTPGCGRLSAHPNSRFTSPLTNCPILDPKWDSPEGVPISAILYGGRRSNDIPLVYQAFNIEGGVYAGLTMCSEATAAATDVTGIRNDPFAMKPFLAYNVGDYVGHLLTVLKNVKHKPLFFSINWFRRDPITKKFLWPGFGQNTRILKWIVDRVHGRTPGLENPIGIIPRYSDIDWTGLDYPESEWDKVMSVDPQSMRSSTLLNQEQLFLTIGHRLPPEMIYLRLLLAARL